ncbi:tryptophan synthase beta subunit-like PLP-dependent enzyme [Lojkania enalia]|uniref:Tryptophan synthase beta subunit-like PLP-dependent enzyme n=1 Tax=Lojkania enalia TaxID=147567 RepID=A0A9P4JW59_9PLEO|nr:tryptophan synthase beta subunit-like PLP-dependent enzyme [Didymosphaeria enalia]
MATNPLNVFKGPDALAQFFDPDKNPPLPLVELPDALNPLRKDGVRIFAKMLTHLPAQNVKSLPVLSLGMISRALWNNDDVHAYVTNKKHPDSLKLLRFFGLNVNLYGGLAQQEPYDPKGIMSRLRRQAKKDPGICYPGQYHNDHNWKAHEQWTGSQIWRQLPEIRVFCSTIGTGGCAVGTGTYLKAQNSAVRVVGVCNVFGDPTPGPRHFPNFESSPFPWKETIDSFENVASANSYRMSMKLSRYGIIAGPSSGEALHGLLSYLSRLKDDGRLSELSDPTTGEIPCVFVCADLPYQYMDMYYKKLGEEEFPPIYNQSLLNCDQDAYDERWFLRPHQAERLLFSHLDPVGALLCSEPSRCFCTMRLFSQISTPSSLSSVATDSLSNGSCQSVDSMFSRPNSPNEPIARSSQIVVIDIRPREMFAAGHICCSYNIPLPETQDDFFGHARAIEQRWLEMKEAFEAEDWPWNEGSRVLMLCVDGDSGRMATAMLRAKGCEAFCVEGGYPALITHLSKIPIE